MSIRNIAYPGPPTSGVGEIDDVAFDRSGTVWVCTVAGSPGTWLQGTGGSGVPSVFGRTGAVAAQSGDYSVAQVTGAAPLASPTFTGTATAPIVDVSGTGGSTTPFRFVGNVGAVGHPTTGTYQLYDVAFDSAGTMWVCTAAGTPGTWTTVTATAQGESDIRANSPDQLAPLAANFTFNGHRGVSLAAPASTTDVAQANNALLGATYYEPASLIEPTTSSASLVAIDTTNLTLSLTAISTVVVVELEAHCAYTAGTTLGAIFWALFTHSTTTQVGYTTAAFQANDTNHTGRVRATIRVTGLTAGTSYQWDWAWAVGSASDTAALVIRAITGVTGGTFGPAIMRAYAG